MNTDNQALLRLCLQQGLGSRKTCKAWIQAARIVHDPTTHTLVIDGIHHPIYPYPTYVALHKPCGYECSQNPSHYPSVLSLLPERLRQMKLQCVGRLDVDTSGLLLLTNDGAWAHRLLAPKQHIQKTYHITLKHAIDTDWLQRLTHTGVRLRDDPDTPSYADAATYLDAYHIHLSIHEGRYHQVRRMIAAAGNRVTHLQRIQIGALHLDQIEAPWQLIDSRMVCG